MEAVEKAGLTVWLFVVCVANVASGVGRNATNVDDYSENDEANAGKNLHDTQHEFDLFAVSSVTRFVSANTHFAVAPDSEELDGDQSDQKRSDPCSISDTLCTRPVLNDAASGGNFEWKDSQPTDGIFPTTSEAPRRIQETTNVHGEGAIDGIHDGQFGEGLHHEIDHHTDDGETDQYRGRSTSLEGATGTNEQTGTNGTTTAMESVNIQDYDVGDLKKWCGETYMAIICMCRPFKPRTSWFVSPSTMATSSGLVLNCRPLAWSASEAFRGFS